MASPFASVADQRVSADRPPRNDGQLDCDRCATLHNAIAIYGWVRSGQSIAAMDKKTWWAKHGSTALQSFLRPSMVKFLKKVFDLPSSNFFYYLTGLAQPKQMAWLSQLLPNEDRKEGDKHRFFTLYLASDDLVSHANGIVYDQHKHKAIFMPSFNHVYDLEDSTLPWQSLESILSAYIDMIEGGKAIALHESIGREAKLGPVRQADDSIVWQELEPAGPAADPYSGARRSRYKTHPWTLISYTQGDLRDCLTVWEKLYNAIESRAGIAPEADQDALPLCGRSALSAANISRGFAYDLLSYARQPQIWYVAPGIRLPGASEFVNQPFKHVARDYPKETEGIKMPFLFFRGEGTVTAKEAAFRWPFSSVEKVPCGLYLDAHPNNQNPFEDACRLVLPFPLGGNKFARTSDGKLIKKSHVDLYQHGINPLIMRHGPKLEAILENWLQNVESGHWSVDSLGVSGGVEVFKRADTQEDWSKYQSSHQAM